MKTPATPPDDPPRQLAAFPAALRKLVEAELKAGNSIAELAHGFPAAPCGAYVKLAQPVAACRRKAAGEIAGPNGRVDSVVLNDAASHPASLAASQQLDLVTGESEGRCQRLFRGLEGARFRYVPVPADRRGRVCWSAGAPAQRRRLREGDQGHVGNDHRQTWLSVYIGSKNHKQIIYLITQFERQIFNCIGRIQFNFFCNEINTVDLLFLF